VADDTEDTEQPADAIDTSQIAMDPDLAPDATAASDLGVGAQPSEADEADVRAAMGEQPDSDSAVSADQPVVPAGWNPSQWDSFIDTSTPQGRAALVQMDNGGPQDGTAAPQGPAPGLISQAASVGYRGAGGPQVAADVFGQYRQRADQQNANDAQLTSEQAQQMRDDLGQVAAGHRAEIAANLVYAHRDGILHDALSAWAENRAQEERQANLQWQAQRQKILGDYQGQLAAVRQLALSSGNPYDSMSQGQAIGLAGAEFAQGFLAAQGIHIDVSGQIDRFVDRSIQQHQQQIENMRTSANDQLHLYDVARQNSMDDAEARQRYGGFVVAALQAQIQANANRYQSNLANAQAATAIAALQVKADQYQNGLIAGYQQRADQRQREAAAAAAAQMRASVEAWNAQTKEMAARAKAGALGAAGALGPDYIADPSDVQYEDVKDPNTGAVIGHQAVSGGRNVWRVLTPAEAKGRMPEAAYNDYFKSAHDTQATYDKIFGLIDDMRQLRASVNTGDPQTIGQRLNANRAAFEQDRNMLVQLVEKSLGTNAGNVMRNYKEFQVLKEMAPDDYLLGTSQAPVLDNTAGELAKQFKAEMAANPAVMYDPQKTYKPYLNVARENTALGNAVVHPMKMSSALPEQQESALEDVSRKDSATAPGDTGKASQMFVNYLNSPANRSGMRAEDFLATNGYRNEYKAIDALAYYAHNPKYIAQSGSLVPVETANDARTRLESIANGKFTDGKDVPGEIQDYARYVLSHMQDAEASFTGDDASRAKLKALSDSLLPSVEYTRSRPQLPVQNTPGMTSFAP
jgi:hypothetical protein